MITLIIVLSLFSLAVIGLGMEDWADGPVAIDEEEARRVGRGRGQPKRLIFSSGAFDIVEEVDRDYSHIRI